VSKRKSVHPGIFFGRRIAAKLNITPKDLKAFIDGGIDVDQELDVHLSTLLGTSLGLWENMQKNHDETKK